MNDPEEQRTGAGDDAAPEEHDPPIADLVDRIRRSRDPVAGLLRPLSHAERQAMADRVLATLAAPPKAALPRRRARFYWVLPAAAALAAAVALVPREPPLVPYQVEVEGDEDQRGAPAEPPKAGPPVRLRPETRLRARLTPEAPARDVAIRLLVVREGRATVIVPPSLQDGRGGFTIDHDAGKLLGEQVDGPVELVFVVGRPLPDDDALARLAVDRTRRVPPAVRIHRQAAVLVGFSPRHGALGFSGCKAVRLGPVCEVERQTQLHVWAEGATASRFVLRLDDREVRSPPATVEGGLRWSLEPAPGSGSLALALAGREVLRVALVEVSGQPGLRAAEALVREGKLDEAEARIDEATEAAAALGAIRLRARIARRRGDHARAGALRDQAILLDRAAGRISDEVDDQTARAFDLIFQDGALTEAGRRLSALPPLPVGDAEDLVKIDYYRGLYAAELGDLRGALAALRAARLGARRFGVTAYASAVLSPLADLLGGLGRYEEAAGILAELTRGLGATTDRCDRVHLVMNHGWVLLRARQTGEARRLLEQAAQLAEVDCPRARADVLTNLAFARHEAGATAEARALLDEARAARPAPVTRMTAWQDRLSLEISLADDPTGALAAAEKVRRAGEVNLSAELLFEAELGRARALARLGDTAAAARAFASAEEALDAWGSLVPLGEGRQTFLDRQDRAARAWLTFLLQEAARPGAGSDAARALALAARRSVARFHRLLGEGDRAGDPDDTEAATRAAYRAARARIDASLSEDRPPSASDLAALRQHRPAAPALRAAPATLLQGEVSLVFHPLLEGWIGIAETADRVTFERLGAVDPTASEAALSAALLAPFRDRLADATTVKVYPHRTLAAVPFHALPWDGSALLDHAAVLQGMDLPPAPAPATCVGPAAALVVADSRGNLAGAGAAAEVVVAALAARGLSVRRIAGEAATVAEIKRALADPCLRLFHYEGHAVFAGRDGILSALVLADGALTAGQILGLPRVPEVVVLSGCSTAEAEGLGLAQAFLSRGAAEVLATGAKVGDASSAKVARRLYEAGGNAVPRLSAAWQRAFPRLRGDGVPPADLVAYRVLGR